MGRFTAPFTLPRQEVSEPLHTKHLRYKVNTTPRSEAVECIKEVSVAYSIHLITMHMSLCDHYTRPVATSASEIEATTSLPKWID